MFSEFQFEEAVAGLYRVLARPTAYESALASVAKLFDAQGALVIRTNPGGIAVSMVNHGYDPALQSEYLGHYAKLDPLRVPLVASTPGIWMPGDDLLDAEQTAAQEYVADFATRAGIRWFRGCKVHQDVHGGSTIFGFLRPHDAKPFDSGIKDVQARILPHLARMARLVAEMQDVPGTENLSVAVLDTLSVAVCVVDADLTVLHANLAALRLLTSSGPLALKGGRLAGVMPGAHAELRHATVLASRRPPQARAFTPNPESGLRERWQVKVLPLEETAELARNVGGTVRAAVFITVGAPELHGDMLCQLYGLTKAEAELVRMLAQGHSPAACAERRGVSLATVRTQVKFIYDKTGVNSLSQLMSLVLALPGAL